MPLLETFPTLLGGGMEMRLSLLPFYLSQKVGDAACQIYLPSTDCAQVSKRQRKKPEFQKFCRQLYHACLDAVFAPLKPYMTKPKVVRCPDGHFRRTIFSLGPYIADYPEQVWLAGIVLNWCPKYVFVNVSVLLELMPVLPVLDVMRIQRILMAPEATAVCTRRPTFLSISLILGSCGMSLGLSMTSWFVLSSVPSRHLLMSKSSTSHLHMDFHVRISMNSLPLTFFTNS
jgi:Plavaka transposase